MTSLGSGVDIFGPFMDGDAILYRIPRLRHDPKILWVDDAEIVGDRITKVRPIPRNLFKQKMSSIGNWVQVA